jgi:hypothetical protein
VASNANLPACRPSFDNLRGSMAGYSATDPSPSWQNRKAFKRELTELMCLESSTRPESWDEVLSEVSEFLAFWKVYYCSINPEDAR